MIKESHVAQLKELVQKNQEANFYICLRTPPADVQYETGKIEKCIVLSPSDSLSRDLRSRLINWTEFVTRFYKEMRSPKCVKLMQFIISESAERDIYLVCSCGPTELNKCHRFILLDLIDNI